jgi:hypothetical protein
MPLTAKGKKILKNMKSEYGEDKGKEVFYASQNKGNISGTHKTGADMNDTYKQGFIDKCAAAGVDPNVLVKRAQGMGAWTSALGGKSSIMAILQKILSGAKALPGKAQAALSAKTPISSGAFLGTGIGAGAVGMGLGAKSERDRNRALPFSDKLKGLVGR